MINNLIIKVWWTYKDQDADDDDNQDYDDDDNDLNERAHHHLHDKGAVVEGKLALDPCCKDSCSCCRLFL